MLFAPLEGWRHAEVTERRTAIDSAKIQRDLCDIHWPKAEKIMLVQDNLNTHSPASLCDAFEPAEARRLVERFEWHFTPKQGSWLNLAQSELAVLSGQYLARRIADAAELTTEVAAWQASRNIHNVKANSAHHDRRRPCKAEEPIPGDLGDVDPLATLDWLKF
jgi:DDE superfamily endonuclease